MLASNIKTVVTRYGEFAYYADDSHIGASLALYGEYSELELALLRQVIKPGWTVVDVGANIGTLTVPLAEMVGDEGRVYAIEAQPEQVLFVSVTYNVSGQQQEMRMEKSSFLQTRWPD